MFRGKAQRGHIPDAGHECGWLYSMCCTRCAVRLNPAQRESCESSRLHQTSPADRDPFVLSRV